MKKNFKSTIKSAILLCLKNVLYWPEDDRLRSKHVAVMGPDCIYHCTDILMCTDGIY